MITSLLLFFIFSLLILLSTIGYGLIFSKILKFENFNYNYGLIGILGLFFLSIIASLTHIILPHNFTHNILIIFFGLISLAISDQKNYKKIKKITIIFILLFICILMSKTNEDFGYYHLPNSLQFAQQKLQFGLGNLNHGFKHISSLFMLMSLSYLPFFGFYLFNLVNLLFLIFLISFVIIEIYQRNTKNSNLGSLILCMFLILFLTKFSRLSEYGADISGQIVIAIYSFYLLEFFYNKNIEFYNKANYLKLSIIMIAFAISLKFISVIYAFLILPIFIILEKKKKFLRELLQINFFIIIFLSISLFIFFNFSATGCLIYPVEKLCLTEKFDWALSSDVIKYLNLHYEVWAKAGAGPNFGVDNKDEYIVFLSWFPNWLKLYFYGKFTDYILVIILMMIIFSLFFFKDVFLKRNKHYGKKNFFCVIYFTFILIFLLWFFNFPSLRYAGYIIIFLLFVFPFLFLIEDKIHFSSREVMKKISIIFVISYSIFLMKNISRINNELKLDINEDHNFKDFPFYWIKTNEFEKIELNNHELYFTKDSCWATTSTCIRDKNIKVTKKNNYIFYSKK